MIQKNADVKALINPVDPEKIRKELIKNGLIIDKNAKEKAPEHRKIFNKA